MSLINGIISFLCVYVALMYMNFYMSSGILIYSALSYVMLIILALFLLINIYFWTMMTIYDLSFGKLFKYSLSFVFLKLPMN